MIFERLPGLPGTGPPPEQFSSKGDGEFRESLVVRFVPDSGDPWIGNFQGGLSDYNDILLHPDDVHVAVIARGEMYLVNPDTRKAPTAAGFPAIVQAYAVDDPRLLILDHQGMAFEAIDRSGSRWHTKRLSWDGFREVAIERETITGEAWDPIGSGWKRFSVNLLTGASSGGSYNRADSVRWERLSDARHASGEPKEAMTETRPATYKLYSPGQVALASFLGSPLAGCMLLAANARRLASTPSAGAFLFYGALGTVALCGIAFVLPDKFPNSILPAACTVGMYQAARHLQGAAFEAHLAAGGKKGSYWKVVGIGVACLVVVLAILLAVFLVLPDSCSVVQ